MAERVAEAVRELIVDGGLADGERINEVRLSAELGVSRTPLREALGRLVAEGALEARSRQGFFVRPLSAAEFSQLYDLRPVLDPEALRIAGLPDAERLARLEQLDRKLTGARSAKAAVTIDDQWHLELLGHCPNRVLVELIQSLMARTRRYELALFREHDNVVRAQGDHSEIMDALRGKNLKRACAALKQNMQSGKAPILEWLHAREAGRGNRGRK